MELSALKRLIQLFEVTESTAEAITIEMARDGSDRSTWSDCWLSCQTFHGTSRLQGRSPLC